MSDDQLNELHQQKDELNKKVEELENLVQEKNQEINKLSQQQLEINNLKMKIADLSMQQQVRLLYNFPCRHRVYVCKLLLIMYTSLSLSLSFSCLVDVGSQTVCRVSKSRR